MRFLRLKRGMMRLVALFLTTIYLLSMAHTLFHNQMHQMLAHAPLLSSAQNSCSQHCCDSTHSDCACSSCHHSHSCSSHTHCNHTSEHYKLYHYQSVDSNSLDHEHHDSDDKKCNISKQYIPSNNSKISFDAKVVNLLPAIAAILICELYLNERVKEVFVLNNLLLPPAPDISYKSLRAPPVFC